MSVMRRLPLIVFTVISLHGTSKAEAITVRLKGLYSCKNSWIATINGKELQILPASAVQDNDQTVITAETPDTVMGEVAAIAITDSNEFVSSMFDDSTTVHLETQSRADELVMLRQRRELLQKMSEDLKSSINLEKEKLGIVTEAVSKGSLPNMKE